MNRFEGEYKLWTQGFSEKEIARLKRKKGEVERGEYTDLTPEAKRLEFARFLYLNGRLRADDSPSSTTMRGWVNEVEKRVKEEWQQNHHEGEEPAPVETQKAENELPPQIKRLKFGRWLYLNGRCNDFPTIEASEKVSEPEAFAKRIKEIREKLKREEAPKTFEQKRLENARSLYTSGWIGSRDDFPTKTKIGEAIENVEEKMENRWQEWLVQERKKFQAQAEPETASSQQTQPNEPNGVKIEDLDNTPERKQAEFVKWLYLNGRIGSYPENVTKEPLGVSQTDIERQKLSNVNKAEEDKKNETGNTTSGEEIEIDWDAPGRGNY